MTLALPRRASPWLALGLSMLLGVGSAFAQRTTLTVTAYPAVDEIIKSALPVWKQRHPEVDVKLISRSFDDHHTAMTTALSIASNLPDVMTLEFARVGRFSAGGGFVDLTQAPYRFGDLAARFVPFAVQQATRADGAVMAVPSDVGPGTLLYRTDLLQKAQVSEAQLTQSWESFVEAGRQIKARTGAYLVSHARDIKDIVIHAETPPGDGLYFDAAGKTVVDAPRFVHAFELARQVREHKLDAKVGAWSNEWSQGLKGGRIVTLMSGAWLTGQLASWIAPATQGLWRSAQLPGGAWAAWGGTFYAIPKGAPNKALAWEFVQMMTLRRDIQLQAFKVQDAFPALIEAHQDPFFDQPLPFLGGQKARLLWRDAAVHVNAIRVSKYDGVAEEIVNSELDKVLDKGKDVRAALADAQRLLDKRAHRGLR